MSSDRIDTLASAIASLPAMTPQRLHKLAESTRKEARDSGPRHHLVSNYSETPVEPADWARLWEGLLKGESSTLKLARLSLGEAGSGRASRRAKDLARRWAVATRAEAHDEPPTGSGDRGDAGSTGGDHTVLVRGLPGYPSALLRDREAPEVLFSAGTIFDPGRAAVAVIGTRSATYYGTEVAAEIGAVLAGAGVTVVSGLASGIDAAAHEGALAPFERAETAPAPASGAGPAIGVLGAGIDIIYPRSTAKLRARVERAGMLLSETPPGCAPEPWRFPLRNRIIAGLASLVVVIESHRAGGSLHTVEAAITRGIEVMAVPGSIRSPASEGTNALIANGVQVVTTPDDVLVALERRGVPVLEAVKRPRTGEPPGRADEARIETLAEGERSVLGAVDLDPTPTTLILSRTGLSLESVSMSLELLAEMGLVRDFGGAWGRAGAAQPAG
jgi:DNA processing protein